MHPRKHQQEQEPAKTPSKAANVRSEVHHWEGCIPLGLITPDHEYQHHMLQIRLSRRVISNTRVILSRCQRRGLASESARATLRLLKEKAALRDHIAAARAAITVSTF